MGEQPSLAEFAERYPDLADEIHELFPLLLELEDVRQAVAEAPLSIREPLGAFPWRLGDYRVIREIGRGGMGATPGNGAGVPVSHVFQSAGLHKVTATPTDSLGLVGPAVILDVSVSSLPFPRPRVTVIGVHLQTVKLRRRKPERVLDVSFSGALEPTPAQDLSDFHLAALGKTKKSDSAGASR